ncbi:MAG: aspartate aminotransferase family protein [Acidimicrobiia bacterium]|nr:aspartate aminotransferase family protein [Acidimicrobiia bacterium]
MTMTVDSGVQGALDLLMDEYAADRPKSRALFERALKVMPGGNTRTQVYFPPFPFYVDSADRARITDVDGHTYLDLVGNYTSLVHGHPSKALIQAIVDQVHKGTAFGAPTSLEIELAEALCARVPSMESVRFTNSGTEAVIYATRAARLFTGRDDLIRAEGGYDGGHDGMQVGLKTFSDGGASSPELGVPSWVADHTYLIPFNDIEGTLEVIDRVGSRSAAVVIEPVQGYAGHLPAHPEYLQAVRAACDQVGCLLIFDEVLTFRLSYGGAQEFYGVQPDLTALGKLIGGGLPVGAFGGRKDVMALFDPRNVSVPFHGGTFNANPMSLAAGLCYLEELDKASIQRINEAGDMLRESINRHAIAADLPIVASGTGSLLRLHGGTEAPRSARDALSRNTAVPELMFYSLMNERVFMGTKRGVMCMSTALEEADVIEASSAFEKAISRVSRLLKEGATG